jgi:cell division protease FtsH
MITILMKYLACCLVLTHGFLPITRYRYSCFRLNYNGNDKNKDQLRGIDYKIERYRKYMTMLIQEKKNLIKNMTDIDITLSNEDYLTQLIGENDEEEEKDEVDFDDNELSGYTIHITPNEPKKGSGSNQKKNSEKETKSENFEVFHDTELNFKNVGGYHLIKEELLQCADMLVNYEKYTKYNVRIPKGLILEGPPGNGKTLLAKCFSGEIKVAFIPVSGSQFQEKFVGVGPARVRELFELASKNMPCIIFIDEIDALCRKRSTDDNSRPEHDSTLNEMLVNMDGFKSKPGIFIMGATNRVDLLDTAMTRPGRIDKKIFVGNPDVNTRKSILRIHMKGKPMDSSISIKDLLEMTQGYSGAQIENFLNEAMLYALRDNRKEMSRLDLETMATRVLTGFQAVESNVSAEQLYQVAVHEMGHAFTAVLTGYKKVIKVSIHLWSPKSLGFTLFEMDETSMITKESLMAELMVLLGGRVAEDIFFGEKISTGASQDIEQTKKLAEQMVVNWGMGDRIIYPSGSEFYRKILEQEMDELIQQAYVKTKTLLNTHMQLIKELSDKLVDKREIKVAEILDRLCV